ncbi:hypothetical protein QUH73_20545, partial [Labilibaculum sp. K2S]|uniref:hypothetical protein n=1 Tax=Labilibaculum sp. K2S TaxID=3056386 RepID=UPI0025A4A9FB
SLKEVVQLPVLAIAPAPAGLSAGAMYINSAGKTLQFYDGAAWQALSCNAPPEAQNVAISGALASGVLLTASYTYYDAESDAENTPPSYQWYRADDTAGTNEVAITGQTASTYTTSDADLLNFVGVKITPKALTGTLTGSTATKYVGLIMPATGVGTFGGKTCFDIALGNDNVDGCGSVSSRTANKSDFTLAATNTQSYTFTPSGTVSNVRFYYANTNGAPVTAISGNNTGNNISAAVTATVTYDNTLNTLAAGLTRLNALAAKIYVLYNDNANNTGTDKQLTLTTSVKDCACCGAMISPTEFREFMCYNLGADNSLDPNVPSQGIAGNYYQWGRSVVVANAYTSAGAISGWDTSRAPDGAWSDETKTSNDPCPEGYRVPTKTVMQGVRDNNYVSWTGTWNVISGNFGTAVHVGTSAGAMNLTFDVAGLRDSDTGSLSGAYSYVMYWTSTGRAGGATSETYRASASNTTPYISDYSRNTGNHVRCVHQ